MNAIEIANLCKRYRVYRRPVDRLKEALSFNRRRYHREYTALDGLTVTIPKGQTTGVIGPNGAGKTTLLKILAGIIEPTGGELRVHGSVASIIELGTGFHPDFTGAENVYLNAGILGFTKEQIDAMYERICRFAELGDYIHMPIKTYSSGMLARLAFAIAINLDPDILLIDEALSVGDAVFANRCLAQIRRMRREGVTIFFVSHDINAVAMLCDRVLFLDRGRLMAEGLPKAVIGRYQEVIAERLARPDEPSRTVSVHSIGAAPATADDIVEQRFGTFEARITTIELFDSKGNLTQKLFSGERARVRMRVVFEKDIPDPIFGVMIKNRYGLEVFGTNTRLKRIETGAFAAGQTADVTFEFDARIGLGVYALSVAVHTAGAEFFDYRVDALTFEVIGALDCIGLCPLETSIAWQTHGMEAYQQDFELLQRLYGGAPADLSLSTGKQFLAGVWYEPHEDYGRPCRWIGDNASVHLCPPPRGARHVGVEFRDRFGGEPAGPGRLTVRVNGVEVAAYLCPNTEWQTLKVGLTESLPEARPARITLLAERTWIPKEVLPGSPDPRPFSFMIARVWLE